MSRRSSRNVRSTLRGDALDEAPSREMDLSASSFSRVLESELEEVRTGRVLRGRLEQAEPASNTHVIEQAHGECLVGLALSGVGVRSATFNLGVLQGLAKAKVLERIDYLSLASGGGFIGGWLTAWIHRRGLRKVIDRLRGGAAAPGKDEEQGENLQGDAPDAGEEIEPGPVRFLRRFSNYLGPGRGVLSSDRWATAVSSARNAFLNVAVLLMSLGVVLLIPRLLLIASREFDRNDAQVLSQIGVNALGFAVFWLGLTMGQIFLERRRDWPWFARAGWVQLLVVIPLFAWAWFFSLWLWYAEAGALAEFDAPEDLSLARWLGERLNWWMEEPLAWALLGCVLYLGSWGIAFIQYLVRHLRKLPTPPHAGRVWSAVFLGAPFAGAAFGMLIWLVTLLARGVEQSLASPVFEGSWNLLHVNTWMPPALVASLGITIFIHAALVGRVLPDSLRQWWTRLGAWTLVYALLWLLVFGSALFGAIVLILLLAAKNVTAVLSTGWVASTVTGLLVGRLRPGGEEKGRAWVRAISRAAPALFAVGLLALAILGLHALMAPSGGPESVAAPPELFGIETQAPPPICDFFLPPRLEGGGGIAPEVIFHCHVRRLWEGTTLRRTAGLIGLLGIFALFLSSRVDINELSRCFSLRERLIKFYLGSSNESRRPQPFTGFDPDDDMPLSLLSARGGYDGPYPVFNATVHVVAGQELAWQDRKEASFVFTPLHAGFDVYGGEAWASLDAFGYRPTSGYLQTARGLSLGTAMAISGAEQMPGEAEDGASSMALFLTVFSAQSGWWLGNPRHRRTWRRMSPRLGIVPPLSRLLGFLNEESRYLYLSGARQFEGLGLYELVRRRCSVILVSDAEADPDHSMRALSQAALMCRTDFGIEVEIDVSGIEKDPDTGKSRDHFAVGRIRYDRVDPGAAAGTLIYWKPSLTGDEPLEVEALHKTNPIFPHEPARDQRFAEERFESYRSLGEHIALSVFGGR